METGRELLHVLLRASIWIVPGSLTRVHQLHVVLPGIAALMLDDFVAKFSSVLRLLAFHAIENRLANEIRPR